MTQCWSFQLDDTDKVLNDVKAWAWSIKDLRRLGGTLYQGGEPLFVRKDVRMSVIYADSPEEKAQELHRHAMAVLQNKDIAVTCVPYAEVTTYAKQAAGLSRLQTLGESIDVDPST